jgi:hypothetical protein
MVTHAYPYIADGGGLAGFVTEPSLSQLAKALTLLAIQVLTLYYATWMPYPFGECLGIGLRIIRVFGFRLAGMAPAIGYLQELAGVWVG